MVPDMGWWASVFLVMWAVAFEAAAQVRLVDGDTLDIGDVRIRLEGIDAPEAGQPCRAGARAYDCAGASMEKLSDLVAGSDVRCVQISEDDFGRVIARCTADGVDIGAEMVASGHAWAFVKYSARYVGEERDAKARGLGIWRGENEPAWEYRARRWAVAEQEAPEGCPIKGNISKNGRIYHPPWSRSYARTKVSVEKGERWFCSEAEAIAAGWRAPRWR